MAKKVVQADPDGVLASAKVRGRRRGNLDPDSFSTNWPVTQGPQTRWQRFKRDMVG